MKTLYLTQGSNILIDTENETANKLDSVREGISRIYLVEEPMHIIYGAGEYSAEADAKKGDLIVTFYNGYFKNQMIVVKNKQWTENIVRWKKEQQEEKERWAAKQNEQTLDDVCTNCEKCGN